MSSNYARTSNVMSLLLKEFTAQNSLVTVLIIQEVWNRAVWNRLQYDVCIIQEIQRTSLAIYSHSAVYLSPELYPGLHGRVLEQPSLQWAHFAEDLLRQRVFLTGGDKITCTES